MSRVGKLPIPVPSEVTVEIKDSTVKVSGPKGTLEQTFDPAMAIALEEGEIRITRPSESADHRARHGLTRALLQNMVTGVTAGVERVLEIQGVGYRANMQGTTLNLSLGFSHPVAVEPPPGISFAVEGTTVIKVSGIDKQLVGQTAANIRAWRKPEPYKGKGIRYQGEFVARKVGKSGSK